MKKEQGEVKFWFTTKSGRHIPVFEGETKADVIARLKERSFKKERGEMQNQAKQAKTAKKNTAPEVKKVAIDKKQAEIEKAQADAKKLNAEEEHRDILKLDNRVTKQNGKMMFKGKEVPELDTKDAGYITVTDEKGEAVDKRKDSLLEHMNGDKLSPEREKLHAKIIEDYFNDHKPLAPDEEKVAYFTGGGGASGKGQFTGKKGNAVEKWYSNNNNPVIIDPDKLKEKFAEADGKTLDAFLTGYYHEESSALAKQIYNTAVQHNYPVLYDGTATGKGVYGLLDSAKKSGYKTEMNFIFSDWDTVRKNSLDRLEGTGRFVPPANVFGAHQKAYSSVQQLKDVVDNFTLYDNAGRTMRKVAEGGAGKNFKILNQTSYDRFGKSNLEFLLDQDATDAYISDARIREQKFKARLKNAK